MTYRETDLAIALGLFGWTRGKGYARPGHEWIRYSEKEEHDLVTSPDGETRIFMCCRPDKFYGESWGNGGRWGDEKGDGIGTSIPRYSGEWDGLALVVEAMEKRAPELVFYLSTESTKDGKWSAGFLQIGGDPCATAPLYEARDDEAPMAVAKAALLYLESRNSKEGA